MASLYQLLATLQQQATIATTGLQMFDAPVDVRVGLYWPPVNTLQRLTKMTPPGALVSVYDRKSGHDSTRWVPSVVAQIAVTTELVSSPTEQIIRGGGTGTIVLSGLLTPGDAVSLVAHGSPFPTLPQSDGSYTWSRTRAVVYSLSNADDLSTAAAGLAAVAAGSTVSAWLSVSASGPVLTVTNTTTVDLSVSSYTGNGGTRTTEIGRRKRDLQLTIWSPTPEIRDLVGGPLEVLIAQLEVFYGLFQSGLVLGDGSFAWVHLVNDFLVDDPMLADLYRRDFIVCADYPVTVVDNLYSVLATVLDYNITA